MPAAGRLDPDAGLAKDPDVAAGGTFGDAEALGELIGRRAGPVLQDLEGAKRSGGWADLVHIAIVNRKWIVRKWL
jgi:hypothetical protein